MREQTPRENPDSRSPQRVGDSAPPRLYHETGQGSIYLGDSFLLLADHVQPGSVDLIITSPPYGLVRKKDYGNVDADDYVGWFKPFAEAFKRALRPRGSLVIDIGGAWVPGQATRSLYHYELLIMLCKELGFPRSYRTGGTPTWNQ